MSIRSIMFTLGLAPLGLLPASSHAAEDRCQTVGEDGYPVFCSPAAEGLAPDWNATACCRGADCRPTNAQGTCTSGWSAYWCEFAELDPSGQLTCLFEVPDICSQQVCPPGDGGGEPLFLCCPYDDFESCFEYEPWLSCDTIWYCSWGASNEDGTYSCLEPESW